MPWRGPVSSLPLVAALTLGGCDTCAAPPVDEPHRPSEASSRARPASAREREQIEDGRRSTYEGVRRLIEGR